MRYRKYHNKGDLLAYLDWAALRPMTETEFEKICRCNQPRVQGEYAWGTNNLGLTISRAAVASGGQESENINSIAVLLLVAHWQAHTQNEPYI